MHIQSITVVNSVHRNPEKHFREPQEWNGMNGARTFNSFYPWYQNYPYKYALNPIAYGILRLSQLRGGRGIFIPHPRKQR